MIEDEYKLTDDLFDTDSPYRWGEEDLTNRTVFALDDRKSGLNVTARPVFMTITGWEIEFTDLHWDRTTVKIRARDVKHAIRVLRQAKWQIRWSRFAQFVYRPRAFLRAGLEKLALERAVCRWLFTYHLNCFRNEGRSWPRSVWQALRLALK